jgi:tetratricopeptide (TPR) repeat protein
MLLFTQWTFGQEKNLKTEDVFKRYLVSEDESIAKIIVNSNDNVYSLFCQGALTENLDEKINLFTKFIELNPKYGLAKAYLNRGISYTLSEKYDSAITDYDKSISLDSQEPYAYYFRGEANASLNKYEVANLDYTKAIKIYPNFLLAYYMRGISFLHQKSYESSLADFTKVIELDKSYDKAYLMRGMVYNQMSNYKKAISDWKDAKKLNKDNSKDTEELIEEANKKLKEKN